MTTPNQAGGLGRWWQVLSALAALLAVVFVLYGDTVMAMVAIWDRSETYAHAYTVLPIVLWLIWQKRQALASLTPQPTAWALFPIGCAGFVWLLGELVASNAITQLAFTALLVLAVLAVLGRQATRVIVFPLVFLFFAVPIGDFLLPLFMGWTADFTVLALRLSGIPVYREELKFVIPSGTWSVVEACGGVRYLVASFMVGTLFAYLKFYSMRRRLIFVGISILVPIVANWIRAYLIVMLGHLTSNRLAVGADHLIYGWVFFGVVMTIMFILGARWSEPAPALKKVSNTAAAVHDTPWRAYVLVTVTIGAAALAALPHVAVWAIGKTEVGQQQPQLAPLASLAPDWQSSDQPLVDWAPAFENPSAQVTRTYKSDDREVGLYVGYYRQQGYGRKLVSSSNVLVKTNNHAWVRAEASTRTLKIGENSVTVRATQLRGAGVAGQATQKRLLVWQTYWINGTLTASDHLAKAYGAFYRLLGRGDDAAVIILYVPYEDLASADATLELFARDNLGTLEAQLRAVRDRR